MEIHIEALKKEINNYNRLVNDYEKCKLNLYNVLGQTSSAWHDGISGKFINRVAKEKVEADNILSQITSVLDVYKFILSRYESFGNKIVFDLGMQAAIRGSFDKYIASLDSVIYRYNTLNLGFYPNEIYQILNQKGRIISVKNDVVLVRDKTMHIFQQLEEIEREVANRIARINITIVKEDDITEYM
ncbi:MAG: hypothetical protein IJ093_00905 [Bacilli bacterium]|nr:hypothetical protein [Bacilli bacterium]